MRSIVNNKKMKFPRQYNARANNKCLLISMNRIQTNEKRPKRINIGGRKKKKLYFV